MSEHTARRAHAPAVLSLDELDEVVAAIKREGAFVFDVETRGNIHRHPDIMAHIEAEWALKLASLKVDHPGTVARSRQAIEDRWTSEVALDPLRNEVFWIGIAVSGMSWAIPMGHPNGEVLVKELRGDGTTVPPPGYRNVLASGKESMAKTKFFVPATFTPPPEQLTQEQVFGALEEVFMDPSITKVNQNIKFDTKSVAKYYGGNLPKGLYVDTQVLMHIEDENLTNYSLESILQRVFGYNPYKVEGKIGKTITTEPFSRATRYVHYDVRWVWLLYQDLWRRISRSSGLYHALFIDLPCLRPVAQMEMNGILVNRREMTKLGKELDMETQRVLRDISTFAPVGFNPDSNVDKAKLLFGKKSEGGLGLKPTKFTDKTKDLPAAQRKPSVDDESLKAQKGKHPLVDLLTEYAELKKMKSTYVEGLDPLLHAVGNGKVLGRLHPQFHFHRTATGRFSSSDPNLQNIPRDGRMRSLFVAGPGDSLIVADYSQIEMRLMAVFSQDPELLRIFREGIDVHTGTAAVILRKDFDDVTPDERQVYGKTPNFLMGYGGGAKRLVASTNGALTEEEAQFIVDGYNKGYAGLTSWKNKLLADGRRNGYVETMGGRRRRVPDLSASRETQDGWRARSRAERQAINAVVQGTASEICKEAMVRVDEMLDFPACKMLVQVHDELVISVPTKELSKWLPAVEVAMGNGNLVTNNGKAQEPVALEVTAHAAGSWAEAKE
jgi:DNA polymerase I-like protein with 3'-5' exonuclease and polymerase domains